MKDFAWLLIGVMIGTLLDSFRYQYELPRAKKPDPEKKDHNNVVVAPSEKQVWQTWGGRLFCRLEEAIKARHLEPFFWVDRCEGRVYEIIVYRSDPEREPILPQMILGKTQIIRFGIIDQNVLGVLFFSGCHSNNQVVSSIRLQGEPKKLIADAIEFLDFTLEPYGSIRAGR